jgi:hypothetical protein
VLRHTQKNVRKNKTGKIVMTDNSRGEVINLKKRMEEFYPATCPIEK